MHWEDARANAGCSLRKLQTRSGSGGNTIKSFLDMSQNSLHYPMGTRNLRPTFSFQNFPLLAHAFKTELRGDIEELAEPWPYQRSSDVRGIPGLRIGPNQSTVLFPEGTPAYDHTKKLSVRPPLGNRN